MTWVWHLKNTRVGEAAHPGPAYSSAQLRGRALEHAFVRLLQGKGEPTAAEAEIRMNVDGVFKPVADARVPEICADMYRRAKAVLDGLEAQGVKILYGESPALYTDGTTKVSVDLQLEHEDRDILCEMKWSDATVTKALNRGIQDLPKLRKLHGGHFCGGRGKKKKRVTTKLTSVLAVTSTSWRLYVESCRALYMDIQAPRAEGSRVYKSGHEKRTETEKGKLTPAAKRAQKKEKAYRRSSQGKATKANADNTYVATDAGQECYKRKRKQEKKTRESEKKTKAEKKKAKKTGIRK